MHDHNETILTPPEYIELINDIPGGARLASWVYNQNELILTSLEYIELIKNLLGGTSLASLVYGGNEPILTSQSDTRVYCLTR